MPSSNIAVLTSSHKIVAAKRRAKRQQIKEVVFDDAARREFLTGFHKRNLQKKEAARKKALEWEKQERLEARREKRRMLAERASQNAAETERAYGCASDDNDEAWSGISPGGAVDKGKGKQREEEYEYQEQVATVTVVEDFDPAELIHGPDLGRTSPAVDTAIPNSEAQIHKPPSGSTSITDHMVRQASGAVKDRRAGLYSTAPTKPKDIKYQTNAARKAEKLKQIKRKADKAVRAGGKTSRKHTSGRRRGGRTG